MAFKEEFEYLSFSCCYCGTLNPSRKTRPSGPKFESTASLSGTLTTHSSDSDSSSESDRDTSEPIVSPLRSDSPDTTEKNSDFDKLSDAEVLSPEHVTDATDPTRDSGFSPTDVHESGDARIISQLEESATGPIETLKNPFEDEYPAGDGLNPFEGVNREHEVSSSPMDFETFDPSDMIPQDGEMADPQITKKTDF